MKSEPEEYKMLKQEIMQYLGEYKSVRNNMYLITVTILGFSLAYNNENSYIFLLPLIIILPSYIISYNYCKCIFKIALYLVVFHERSEDCVFKWETMHRRFNEEDRHMSESDYQRVPYFFSSGVCLLLYFLNIDIKLGTELYIGAICIMLSIIVFYKYNKINSDKIMKDWELVKYKYEYNKRS